MTIVQELITHDVPLLAFVKDQGEQLAIALVVDRDSGLTRWVQSPISKTQHEALLLGGLSVRDAITTPTEVSVVDYSNNSQLPLRWWQIKPSEIPESCLPERGSLLPSHVRARYAASLEAVEAPEWHFAGPDISDDMAFGKVSAATKTLQRLVNAICEWRSLPRFELRMAAMHAGGSMVMRARGADAEAFAIVAKEYRKLALSTYDKEGLRQALLDSSKKVADCYGEYLKFVDANKIEVLAEWPAGSAYVGFSGVKVGRESANDAKLELTERAEINILGLRGFFEGFTFGGKGRFEFYDLTDAQTYVGKVASGLREQLRGDEHFNLMLGKMTQKYDVTIEVATIPSKPRADYTLVDYRAVESEPELPLRMK